METAFKSEKPSLVPTSVMVKGRGQRREDLSSNHASSSIPTLRDAGSHSGSSSSETLLTGWTLGTKRVTLHNGPWHHVFRILTYWAKAYSSKHKLVLTYKSCKSFFIGALQTRVKRSQWRWLSDHYVFPPCSWGIRDEPLEVRRPGLGIGLDHSISVPTIDGSATQHDSKTTPRKIAIRRVLLKNTIPIIVGSNRVDVFSPYTCR